MIYFKENVWKELMFYTKKRAPKEISLLGNAKPIEGGFLVEKLVVVENESDQANTTMSPVAVAEAFSRPRIPNCWIHSHGNGKVFWSATDEKTIEQLKGGKFFISVVVNSKEEAKGTIWISLYGKNIRMEDEVSVLTEIPEEWEKNLKKFKDKKVQEYQAGKYYGHDYGYQSWADDFYWDEEDVTMGFITNLEIKERNYLDGKITKKDLYNFLQKNRQSLEYYYGVKPAEYLQAVENCKTQNTKENK